MKAVRLETLQHSVVPATNTYATAAKSPHQNYVQQILVVTSATISLILGLLTVYWFVRIKKTFSHHLIILLILTNMVKSFGFLVYPIVELRQHLKDVNTEIPTPLPQGFCLFDGLSIAWGIEAADFVILLIALHTALTIFRPRTTAEDTGLYPYRWVAYFALITLPSLTAALAFINKTGPYVSSGTSCYLPSRPIWIRLTLSWVPRYLILLTILGVYLAVYRYARFMFNAFEHDSSHATENGVPPTRSGVADMPLGPLELAGNDQTTTMFPVLPKVPQHTRKAPNARVTERHRTLEHQIRLMFVYPIVYFIFWIPPFVNHCWLHTGRYSPPFALTSLSVVCQASQCAAYCLVFMVREKPWRLWRKEGKIPWDDNFHVQQRERGEQTNITPIRKRRTPLRGADGSRHWWDQDVFSTDSSAAEGSISGSTEKKQLRSTEDRSMAIEPTPYA